VENVAFMSVIRQAFLINWGFALPITMNMKRLNKKLYKMIIIYDDRLLFMILIVAATDCVPTKRIIDDDDVFPIVLAGRSNYKA
jgi:hypothetical protein